MMDKFPQFKIQFSTLLKTSLLLFFLPKSFVPSFEGKKKTIGYFLKLKVSQYNLSSKIWIYNIFKFFKQNETNNRRNKFFISVCLKIRHQIFFIT